MQILKRPANFIAQLFSWLCLGTGVVTAGFMVYLTALSYSVVPWMDPWYFFFELDKWHLPFWKLLWIQHIEHRIVFPKLFYLADFYWFHGTGLFLLISIYVIETAHCALLIWFLRTSRVLGPTALRSAAGLILFCLFCPAQRETFITGWQIAYVLPTFLSTLAVIALAVGSKSKSSKPFSFWVLTAWIAALISSFSLLSGFSIWPVLCLEGVMLGMHRRTWITTGALGAGALMLNAIGFHLYGNTSLAGLGQHLGEVLAFFDFLMAESWEPISFRVGVAATYVAIVVCIAILLRRVARRPVKDFCVRSTLIAVALSGLAATAMTTLGRWRLGFANRYEEPVSVFWCAFGLLLLSLVESRESKLLLPVQLVLLFLMIAGKGRVESLVREARVHSQSLNLAGAAFVSGVKDTHVTSAIPMATESTFGELNFLKEHKAALYATRPASLIGTRLSDSYRVVENGCGGQVKSAGVVLDKTWPGVSIRGTAWDALRHNPIETLITTDSTGRIVGLGANDSVIRSGSPQLTWNAFSPVSAARKQIRVYGVLSDHDVCTLSEGSVVDTIPYLAQFPEPLSTITRIWSPADGMPRVVGGEATISNGVLAIRSETNDTQALFNTKIDLSQFSALVIKAKFTRLDTVEMFFGREIDGRGIDGFVSTIDQWVILRANVELNRYWRSEAGTEVRFDPTGANGPGSITLIAGIWGSKVSASPGSDFFDVYRIPKE